MANDCTAPAPADSGGSPAAAIDRGYDPAPESADIVRLRSSYRLLIGGEWVDPGPTGAGSRPSTRPPRRSWPRSPRPGLAMAERAVAAARAALPAWAALPGAERAKYLFRVARIVQERARELAVLELHGRRQADQGVPRRRPAPGRRALLLPRRVGGQAGAAFLGRRAPARSACAPR